jgi:uncharacterized protein
VKIKAVLDTNVFISGVFWKGPPFEVPRAWQEERFRLAISLPIFQEYRRALAELTRVRAVPVLTSVLRIIELHSEMVEPVSFAKPVCSDPDDDKFLEAAIAASADYVVSGDKALLNLKSHFGIEIVRPARFLKLLCG